jgi:hypothetical protein
MARVTIIRGWSDGDVLRVSVNADGYPDALDEARAIATRAFAEALDITVAEPDE